MAESQDTAAQSLAQLSVSTTSEPHLTIPKTSSPTTKKRFRSPDPVILRKSLSPSSNIQPTGLGEMAEAKRRRTGKDMSAPQSKNPAAEALSALSGTQATSKASDAPNNNTTPNLSALTPTARHIELPAAQTSPAPTEWKGINSSIPVESPGAMDEDTEAGTAENKAMSYPPPFTANTGQQEDQEAKRGMSLPGSASRDTKSPASSKKHKCPYCSTEFTRHHNLKSHLLTHSHEKPYLCETCDSRFRRLHDLKRHTKLHTGERPHICPKCNRRFARGDALARHTKGQGGCAGRRSSIGEFANEEDAMEGMVYTEGQSQEPENLEEDGGAAVPAIRHHAPIQQQQQQGPYRSETHNPLQRGGSTYPPIAARANMAAPLHPSGHASHPSAGQLPGSYAAGGVFPNSHMTESPKPLSPGNVYQPPPDRTSSNHSYGRRRTRTTPPPTLLPVTNNQLPSLSGLAPPDSRYVLHSTPGGPSPTLPHPASGTFPPHSASNSLSSHGTGPHGSGERGHLMISAEDRLWAVIKSLEKKVENLEAEVRMLRDQQSSPTQTVPPGSILPPVR